MYITDNLSRCFNCFTELGPKNSCNFLSRVTLCALSVIAGFLAAYFGLGIAAAIAIPAAMFVITLGIPLLKIGLQHCQNKNPPPLSAQQEFFNLAEASKEEIKAFFNSKIDQVLVNLEVENNETLLYKVVKNSIDKLTSREQVDLTLFNCLMNRPDIEINPSTNSPFLYALEWYHSYRDNETMQYFIAKLLERRPLILTLTLQGFADLLKYYFLAEKNFPEVQLPNEAWLKLQCKIIMPKLLKDQHHLVQWYEVVLAEPKYTPFTNFLQKIGLRIEEIDGKKTVTFNPEN